MKKLVDPEVKKMSLKEKQAILKGEMALINKKFKKQVVAFGTHKALNRIPFKSKNLNDMIGGGVPCGRFTVMWGGKGSGKTTNCYDLVANAQQMGKTCLWLDFERSFDPTWAAKQGVLVEDLLLAPAFNNAEEAMDLVISLTKSKAIDLIIIDSLQGLSPLGEQENKKGVEKSMVDDTMALLARKLSQFFRMSSGQVAESDCTVVMIGQTRMDLGGYITLEKLSGGNALEHWSSLTLHIRRGAKKDAPMKKDDKEEVDGFNMVVKVDKSKLGPDEGKTCNVTFRFGVGIENNENVIEEAKEDDQE